MQNRLGPMSSMPNCLLIPTMDPHYNFFAFDYLTKKLFIKQQQQQQNNRREKKKRNKRSEDAERPLKRISVAYDET